MIECPKCHQEYRGYIPKYCIECGTKLPDKNETQQEKVERDTCYQALHICPSCRTAIYTLNIRIPEQLGTVDLDVPQEDNPLVNMCEVPEPIISCPECKETIPQDILDEWKVRIDKI